MCTSSPALRENTELGHIGQPKRFTGTLRDDRICTFIPPVLTSLYPPPPDPPPRLIVKRREPCFLLNCPLTVQLIFLFLLLPSNLTKSWDSHLFSLQSLLLDFFFFFLCRLMSSCDNWMLQSGCWWDWVPD